MVGRSLRSIYEWIITAHAKWFSLDQESDRFRAIEHIQSDERRDWEIK